METAKYLCEFFFCDGFSSFFRCLVVCAMFYCLSPKINTYNIGSKDFDKLFGNNEE
jgi:hypothetical protein